MTEGWEMAGELTYFDAAELESRASRCETFCKTGVSANIFMYFSCRNSQQDGPAHGWWPAPSCLLAVRVPRILRPKAA